ncbi:MAG: antitoxin [Allorhizobium sp.]
MEKWELVEREISVFRNGRSQAVRIPKEFEIDTDTVMISRDAEGTIYLRPKEKVRTIVGLLDWLAEQEPFGEQMPEIEDPVPDPVDLGDTD